MSGSRELPVRPNLSHLKNEAKALHRAYERGDANAANRVRAMIGDRPEFRLLDAQRVIAREYGFEKWSELRDAVTARLTVAAASFDTHLAPPLTTRAQVAIAIARGIAGAHGYAGASAGHVALGVLREGENAAVGALHQSSVPLRELRYDLERALAGDKQSLGVPLSLEASAEELELVALAAREATERGRPFVASEHLMLALLRNAESDMGKFFGAYDVCYATFSQHLEVVLSGA